MKITATKVASTKTHDAYDIRFELDGYTSAIFRCDDESVIMKDEITNAVIDAVKRCRIDIVDSQTTA